MGKFLHEFRTFNSPIRMLVMALFMLLQFDGLGSGEVLTKIR